MRLASLVLFLLFGMVLFTGCTKKDPQVEFRPLQLRWFLLPGQSDEDMPTKDNCVIRLTGRLMGEAPVQASLVEELEYRVDYGRSSENPEILHFEGVCEDSSLLSRPECKWSATCDPDLSIVVKFHNGD